MQISDLQCVHAWTRPDVALMQRLATLVFRATAIFAVACLMIAGLITVVDIVLRFFGGAVPGAVDLVQLFIVATAFAAIPWAFHTDGHVGVDLMTEWLPERAQAVLRATAALAGAGVMTLILIYGWQTAALQMRFGDVSQNLGVPLVWYWTPLLAGAALSIAACLLAAATAFRR